MRYDFCLFDADDTLLDFKAEQLIAFRATFRQYGYPYHEQEMLRVYNQINHRLWAAFEKGEIRKQDIIDRRFQELFDHFGINGDSRHGADPGTGGQDAAVCCHQRHEGHAGAADAPQRSCPVF